MVEKMDIERAPFESWVRTTSGWKACKQRDKPMHLRQNADGSYNDFRVNDRWCAWKARAHLAQPAQAVDVGAIREVINYLQDEGNACIATGDGLDAQWGSRILSMSRKLTRAIGNAHDNE